MRTHGKDFDRYMDRAKAESGVRFVRCKVNGVEPDGDSGDLRLSYVNEEGRQIEEFYDMVVLSVGLQTDKKTLALAESTSIKLTANKFAATSDFAPVQTSREGIFTCGAFAGPKDIPQSVVEGSAAAAAVGELLAPCRHELSTEPTFPAEKDVCGEDPRLGIFICHCGSNIAGTIDVEAVEEYAKTLPNVAYVERNLFSCSQDTQDQLVKRIREQELNRIVVAACTPRTHEPLFRETLKAAGLNEYLIEMANIRNHGSWVHADNPAMATAKAKDLIRMAAAKVTYGASLKPIEVQITQKALVVGGGVSGMTSALNLADQGFEVHLVEKTDTLGGNALHLKESWSGEHIPGKVSKLIDRVVWNEKIIIHKEFEVANVDGFVGNFKTTIKTKDGLTKNIEHGVGIIATGGSIYRPDEYGYGRIKRVVLSIEFDKLHELKERHVSAANNFVFIQCVGSREGDANYCSKVCCTHSVQTAIKLKKEDPKRNIYILYRDMRTYGEREALFRQARRMGVIFINYELHGKPLVEENESTIDVQVWDHVLHRPLQIKADMVILATAIRPKEDAKNLAQLFKVPVDGDGFFLEAHAKLRPVDFSTDGMFVAGLAHYPKPIEESVAQALAASARAATLLSRTEISLDAIKATVDKNNCDGCALCIDVCPYGAITLVEDDAIGGSERIIAVNKAKCKGCGLCQGTCPKRGVHVAGFTMKQISSQIQAALAV
jgi:heterodisulfide reductase subunit A